MKIILFMATSLNGMIATKEGNEDFLSHTNWESFLQEAKNHGCFIIGRTTFEKVQQWPEYNFSSVDAKLKIVVSHDKSFKIDPPFMVANSPQDAIDKAASQGFESAILTGGSAINRAFLVENLVDEVLINIEPALIGSGIPLFAESAIEKRLHLVETNQLSSDILQVRYVVKK